MLVDDATAVPIRSGGFVQTMGLQSYVAVPLLSADGPLGLVICGGSTVRRWTEREERLARQLALEGALVVDGARLRASERVRIAALTYQAFHDSLTGLPNRSLLLDRLTQALEHAARSGEQLALLLLDLDDFKQVNDTLGHHYGDVLLQQVAARLPGLLRGSDTVARLGGDEFAILLTTDVDVAAATRVAAMIEGSFEEPFQLGDLSLQAVASIGIALYPAHGDDATVLLQRADVGMYEAKRRRTGPVVYEPAADGATVDKLTLSTELRAAIEHGELRLHYQPKLDLRTSAVVGVEALVRWQHPRRGLLAPGEFLAVAEATGLIDGLTRWALREAGRQWQRWYDAGVLLELAVNLSVRSLHDPRFLDDLAGVLGDVAVAPHLVLEITETDVMADTCLATRSLERIRALGVRVSVDDFGSGYSSLAYLRDLPIDELKIDRMLVRDVSRTPRDRAIVEAVVNLGHCVGVRVVAEGVEDDATRVVLEELGCDEVPGFHLSRPLPAEELLRWLDAGRPACCRGVRPAVHRVAHPVG